MIENANLQVYCSCLPGWERLLTPCWPVLVKETSFFHLTAELDHTERQYFTKCRSNILQVTPNILLLTWGRVFEACSRPQVCSNWSPFETLHSTSLVGNGVDYSGNKTEVIMFPNNFISFKSNLQGKELTCIVLGRPSHGIFKSDKIKWFTNIIFLKSHWAKLR